VLLNTLVIIGEVFGMHHQLGGSTEDDMNKMSVIGHISQQFMYWNAAFPDGGERGEHT
jgi:hypothetical protein